MRPQEGRRFPDEMFYFDKGELVVDEEVLPEHFPKVEVLDGRSVVGTFTGLSGDVHAVEHVGLGWEHYLAPGDRLLGIQSGNGVVRREVGNDDSRQLSCTGNITGELKVETGDMFFAKRRSLQRSELLILPANEPLPGGDFSNINGYSYEPLGIFRQDGQLITWGHDGSIAKRHVDLSIANGLVNNRLSNYILSLQLVSNGSIVGRVGCDEIASAYLVWFQEKFGTDFVPTKDPADRWDEFPTPPTQEQIDRYRHN